MRRAAGDKIHGKHSPLYNDWRAYSDTRKAVLHVGRIRGKWQPRTGGKTEILGLDVSLQDDYNTSLEEL